ncbi:UBP1-associated proteins 1C [Mercurialis annua]|uniref:UBP1-associated proteins 1C n=1 Tax=Mercurialis annua TaxID=3986 RepID=UPI0021606774|nr:UBP1-associated proteins 1C [Mercurialis annua]
MVWFQCEDCGESLKKPKLLNHFRICSAYKLSCIDCGEMFGQDSVQRHTQCITEAEKYGPKGQGGVSNGKTTATPKSNKKQHPDVDITVGLSDRPPWYCSLCNTKATSKQALLIHADGKKHRAKARAIHAAKQQQDQPTIDSTATETTLNGESHGNGHVKEQTVQDTPATHDNSGTDNSKLQSEKKRKLDDSESNGKNTSGDALEETNQGMIQEENAKADGKGSQLKKAKHNGLEDSKVVDSGVKNIKLKKLIKSTLKTNPDGVLKMKKLKKIAVKSLRESGKTEDETQLNDMIEQKINTSSRFRVDNKYVHLVAKD